jgi:hypothetical protein
MLIRMSRWTSRPDVDEGARARWNELVRPVWYSQTGLRQAHILAERGTLNRMTLTAWQSVAAYEAFLASPTLPRLAPMFDDFYDGEDGRPEATAWLVLTDDWPEPERKPRRNEQPMT